MFYRWECPYSNWELDFKQCSFDRAVRILHHLPFNIFRISMLFTHALVPSAFRLQVSAMIQESPSKFFLTASGILKPRHAAHRSKTPTGGVLMRPLDKKPGRLSRNGSLPSVWNWVMCLSRLRCARPSLLPPSKRPELGRRLCRAMRSRSRALPWKAGRFSGQDFAHEGDGALSCPAGKTLRPTEQQSFADGSLCVLYSARILDCRGCPKRLQCQWHGEATTKPRRGSRLLHRLRVGPAPLRLSGLESERTPACLYAARATPTHRGEPAASGRSFATHSGRDPVPRAACPCSPLVGRAVGSQWASFNSWPSHDEAVRHPRTLCRLARFGDGVRSF